MVLAQQPVCVPVYQQSARLLDDRFITVRPADPGDMVGMKAFFERLGPETRFLRFHYTRAYISDNEIATYCNCDYDGTFVIVAEMYRNGHQEIVGVGRYDRLPRRDAAEVAFLVEDAEQRKGIGTHLVRLLAEAARERGVSTFVAETTNYNYTMLGIFEKYDRCLKREIDGESCKVTYRPQERKKPSMATTEPVCP
jgi:RimJ/RimL family protein N-acetyltransferase